MKPQSFKRVGKRLGSFVALIAATAISFVAIDVPDASAAKGGNGGGNSGNSNAGGNSGNSNAGGNGRGRQNGNNGNAAASMPEKLEGYRSAYVAVMTAREQADNLGRTVRALQDMGESGFRQRYPNADYQATMNQYLQNYSQATQGVANAEAALNTALAQVTGGQAISATALQELNTMLGL